MKRPFLCAICAVAFVLCACGQSTPPPDEPAASSEPSQAQPEAKPDLSKLALKTDPICEMDLEKTPIAATYEYNGKTYGFCSDYCKTEFEKDPEKALQKAGQEAVH
jgi:YHS domain-containing protein